jgi:hypothetical protein
VLVRPVPFPFFLSFPFSCPFPFPPTHAPTHPRTHPPSLPPSLPPQLLRPRSIWQPASSPRVVARAGTLSSWHESQHEPRPRALPAVHGHLPEGRL